MPKGDRRSLHNTGGYYLQSPVTSTQPYSDSYYTVPLQTMSQSPYTQPQHHQHQQSYSTGGPVQPISQSQSQLYTMPPSAPLQPVQSPLTSLRPSSGAWSPADDHTLMQARSAGMNWQPIKQMYFPLKTPNACRKRHERLMEKRNADDWDGMKLEGLARSYMGMRREIWAGLAEATGEKWSVVEQKVFPPFTMWNWKMRLIKKNSACPKESKTFKQPPAPQLAAKDCRQTTILTPPTHHLLTHQVTHPIPRPQSVMTQGLKLKISSRGITTMGLPIVHPTEGMAIPTRIPVAVVSVAGVKMATLLTEDK